MFELSALQFFRLEGSAILRALRQYLCFNRMTLHSELVIYHSQLRQRYLTTALGKALGMAEACVSLEEDTHLKNKTPKINLRKEIKIQISKSVSCKCDDDNEARSNSGGAPLPYYFTSRTPAPSTWYCYDIEIAHQRNALFISFGNDYFIHHTQSCW